jgi:predicted amidohydrolase
VSSGSRHSTIHVALAQVDCALGDVEENARRAREAIARARADGADLVVFPELSLTGYALGLVPEDVALTLDDPIVTDLAEAADGVGVVIGLLEQGRVHVYNSAIYLHGGKIVHVQRKTHLPTYGRWEESKHYSQGASLRAFDTTLGRFAVLICNDAWQAPMAYVAVHDGARVLIVPTWVVFVNRVGEEAGMTFWGGSRVVDPWGRTVAQAPRGEPAIVHAEVDLYAVRRRRRESPLLKEPRLELVRREVDRLIDGITD